jgi:hypothetical protein
MGGYKTDVHTQSAISAFSGNATRGEKCHTWMTQENANLLRWNEITKKQRKHALTHDTPFCISQFIFYLIFSLSLVYTTFTLGEEGERTLV